jgi:peptidyl-prolyl cis-trans isomerase D
MSIIQKIRDRAAWLVFGLIALSLVGFLAMDAFVGRSRLFGGNTTTIGSVNGQDIEYSQFQTVVEAMESNYKAQNVPINESMTQNIRGQVWDQMVEDDLLDKIYQKTGITVSEKELNDMLAGPDPVQGIRQAFTDKKTGLYDAQNAAATINELRNIYKSAKKTNNNYDNARRLFEELIPQWIKEREKEKYLSMMGNSAYVPKWMAEKMNSDQTQIASFSYVNTPYSSIADSTIHISDDEIGSYVENHKDQYKQEESRSIAYVVFNAAPTSKDSADILNRIKDLKSEFDTTHDVESFIARNGSDMQYAGEYFAKSKIQVPNKDSIFKLPNNGVFGPYLDGGDYVLAKKMDEKTLPDTVKCRHILVSTNTEDGGFPDSIASKKIDSIKAAVASGASWASLVEQYNPASDGSKQNKGEMTFSASDIQSPNFAKEFAQFILFDGKAGERKVVKTSFGYHYIEILEQKNPQPFYKVAYYARKIEPSNETDQAASGMANQFAGDSRNAAAFDENVKKDNYQKLVASDVPRLSSMIPALGSSRELVKWIFGDKTGIGDVSEPYDLGEKYVVSIVTEINKEGTMTATKARTVVEPILRNLKKADQIIVKIGKASTLEAVAHATAQQVRQADSVAFSSPFVPNVGQEPKVIGSAFNKQLQGKPMSDPIAGNGGVFVIKVESVGAKPNTGADISQVVNGMEQQEKQMISSPYRNGLIEALKKTAKIKDNRSKFF